MTHVRWTIVNGVVRYNKAKEGIFAHIRPEGGPVEPVDYWPRRLEAPWLPRD